MKLLLIALWSWCIAFAPPPLSTPTEHPIHISKCNIDIKPDKQNIQISIHIFADDLEFALQQQGKPNLRLHSKNELAEANTLILEYLRKTFLLKVNGAMVQYDWVGKEASHDWQGVWIYLEVKNLKEIKNLWVESRILLELYSDHKNMLEIKYSNAKKGYLIFNHSKYTETINF
jgi:hypothetical protein